MAGVILGILFLVELMLRLTNAAVARHSLALAVLTIILVAVFVRFWVWNGNANLH